MSYWNVIKNLDEKDHYKYLGILQATYIKHTDIKKLSNEYIIGAFS